MSAIPSRQPCRGPSRREVLRVGSLGFLGLGLDEWFRLRAVAGSKSGELAKVKNCILIWLAGGPSHIDTFDPKPGRAVDVRGEFKPIATSVPGLQISEVFPEPGQGHGPGDPDPQHDLARIRPRPGRPPPVDRLSPVAGPGVSGLRQRGLQGREATRGMLPPYVAVPDAPIFASSGYLTPAYDPFSVSGDPNQATFRVQNLTPPDRLTLERLLRRRDMVKKLDDFAHDVPGTPLTSSRDQFAERAYSLLTSSAAQSAFRMNEEPAAVRDKYGRTTVGQSCLLARRLVEAGVSFVTVNDRGTGPLGWDTHAQNFPTIKNTLAPPLDKGVAALVEDLSERGLLDSTLVVMMGEFGRTPKINPNAGRDHHGRANSVLLFGAGIPGGLVLGRTDANGDAPGRASRDTRPTWRRCSITSWASTRRPSTKRPTAGRSAWSTAAIRRRSCSDNTRAGFGAVVSRYPEPITCAPCPADPPAQIPGDRLPQTDMHLVIEVPLISDPFPTPSNGLISRNGRRILGGKVSWQMRSI